jgi:hypothetical protein
MGKSNLFLSTSNDVSDGWSSLIRIINEVVPITQFAAPGGWNDLDLLEVGNSGLTFAEQQTQFAFWAAAKCVLVFLCVFLYYIAIGTNDEIIAYFYSWLSGPRF